MINKKILTLSLLFVFLCGIFYFSYKNIHTATTLNGESTKIITLNNISYDIYNFELFSGESIGKENNTLKYKNIIDNGKITKMINYYPNGNIKAELILKDDEIVFYTSRYENGNLHFMIPLVNKKYNGNIIVYYENGKIALQGNLKDGEIIDYFYIFQRNGMLKYKYNNYEVLKVNEDNLLLEPIKIESEIQEFKICLSQLMKIEDYNIKE
ncbi:hypothetical protein PWA69_001454 [Campylobacter coli]|uniref:toxin-antitoxin system YwqK family antitoxin n=1 Tax=Campylobacterales TaxID=213849 RepID=UPI000CF0E514|nr:hypothetical protein [Helicobacter pullorum]EKM9865211.1 hypothetical protein [Campylobacter coli]ELT5465217.1 hypothetical protein [Campylobacter coli]HEF9143761.1 hypothetical protein [Campylobacter coli]HEF9210303.1 hypothetical protein [Campylobacter coli]